MSERTSRGDAGGCYEILIQGHLHTRWSAWFDGMTVTSESNGCTLIRGDVVDQAALHGLLRKLSDLGLPLLSVARCRPDRGGTESPQRRSPT